MTTPNPDAELLAAMAEYDLQPPQITWDGNFHRFPGVGQNGRGDAGWYKAYPDREGAIFGCHRTKLSSTWKLRKDSNGFDADEFRRAKQRWKKERKEREQERRRVQRAAAEHAMKLWRKADPVGPEGHPYLASKGVIHPERTGLRVDEKGRLLIPMKSVESDPGTGKPRLVSLLRVSPDGTKRFLRGGRVKATRTTIGAEYLRPDGAIYVCEGWATGWSVSHVRRAPALVAFTRDNLTDVTAYVAEEFGQTHEVVVACDNDRWSRHYTGDNEPVPNPGVYDGRAAAEAADVKYAIPDFQPAHIPADGSKGPTDFNDLHQLEGPAAVKQWSDPERAPLATTMSDDLRNEFEKKEKDDKPEKAEPPPADEPEHMAHVPSWEESAKFRVLGHSRGTYYFLPPTGETVNFTATQLERKANLYRLMPLPWWERYFPGRGDGVSWSAAVNALIQAAHRRGLWEPSRVRGCGCWPEETKDGEKGVLIHLGDRMIVPGSKQLHQPHTFLSPTGYTYEARPPVQGPSMDPMPTEKTRDILETFRFLQWSSPSSGDLLAGWTVLAPVCGALDWRPHVWLTGERGAGKTVVARDLVVPLLAGMELYVQGETTEAGMRQDLGADAFPVVFDEAEEGEGTGSRIQRVLALARQSSSESDARTLKGTVHGSSLQYRIRSMFCFASIGGAVKEEADRSRIAMLHLKGASQVPPDEKREHWEQLQPQLLNITRNTGRRLMARTVKLIRNGVLPETIRVFRQAAGAVLGDQRNGDQYGTLYAGAWTLEHDDVPDPLTARELVGSDDLQSYQEDQRPQGLKALQLLLQQRERVETSNGVRTLAVGELLDISRGSTGACSIEEADRVLGQLGLAVEVEDGSFILYVANNSEWIEKVTRGTLYARGIRTVLRSLKGADAGGQRRFHPGLACRTTRIPWSVIHEV